jgi:P-type E1-E2 ATPase
MDLTPQTAHLKRADGSEEEVPAEAVEAGSLLVVKPGERIPLDGRVASGLSEVNQAPITGESVPVLKNPGTIDAQQSKKVASDLLNIIDLSSNIKRNADRLNKTSQ